jgi:hypothetical protein
MATHDFGPPTEAPDGNGRTVKHERTGWRDLRLSQRHRRWGWNCPAIDLDFLLLEYDRGKAVAIVEYKHERAPLQFPMHPSYQALIDLGDRAGVPVFACRYADDFTWWRAIPLNRTAKQWMTDRSRMSEPEWVGFLYRMRGYELPPEVFADSEAAI